MESYCDFERIVNFVDFEVRVSGSCDALHRHTSNHSLECLFVRSRELQRFGPATIEGLGESTRCDWQVYLRGRTICVLFVRGVFCRGNDDVTGVFHTAERSEVRAQTLLAISQL